MTAKSRARLNSRTLLLGGCALVLAWLVVSRSVAAYLVDTAPNTALWLNPGQPDALINLADRSLNASSTTFGSPDGGANQAPAEPKAAGLEEPGAKPPPDGGLSPQQNNASDNANSAANGPVRNQSLSDTFALIDPNRSVDLSELRAQTISALMQVPLNARGLRVLGQIEATDNDNGAAAKLMAEAARLSLHQSIAVYWLMRKNAQYGDYNVAIAYADALLRTNPDLARYVIPILARFADDTKSAAAVEAAARAKVAELTAAFPVYRTR